MTAPRVNYVIDMDFYRWLKKNDIKEFKTVSEVYDITLAEKVQAEAEREKILDSLHVVTTRIKEMTVELIRLDTSRNRIIEQAQRKRIEHDLR